MFFRSPRLYRVDDVYKAFSTDEVARRFVEGYYIRDCTDMLLQADRRGISPENVLSSRKLNEKRQESLYDYLKDLTEYVISTALYEIPDVQQEDDIRERVCEEYQV